MSEMVDRVGRAIADALSTPNARWDHVARAAIEAMREPTEDMLFAPSAISTDFDEIWKAMIDAALKPLD